MKSRLCTPSVSTRVHTSGRTQQVGLCMKPLNVRIINECDVLEDHQSEFF